MERPSSRAGMHPEKERRHHMNGGSKGKHKSKSSNKSSQNGLLNNHHPPYFNCSDPYMSGYGPMMGMNPLAHRYIPPSLYPDNAYVPEPVSLPVYPMSPWSLPSIPRPRPPVLDVWSPQYTTNSRLNNMNRLAPHSTGPWQQEDEDFTSLPPTVNDIKPPSTSSRPDQHRFSDPGLPAAAPEGSTESSSSSSEEDTSQGGLVQRLLLEMSTLRESNVRLMRELEDTRAQLDMLRVQQSSSWRRMGSDYQPGMLADMVREVREASRIREEAMMSRLRLASSSGVASEVDCPLLLESQNYGPKRTSLEMAELRGQLQRAVTERRLSDSLQQRLHRDRVHGEEQRRRRRSGRHDSSRGSYRASTEDDDEEESSLSATSASPSTKQLELETRRELEQLRRERQQLTGELRQARDTRAETDAHVQKLERLVGILRKKITAMNGVQEPTLLHAPSPVIEANVNQHESLTSSSGSSTGSSLENPAPPIPQPQTLTSQVLIHGPVTNL